MNLERVRVKKKERGVMGSSSVFSNIIQTPFLRNLLFACLGISITFPLHNILFEQPSYTQLSIERIEGEARRTARFLAGLVISDNLEFKKDLFSKDVQEKLVANQKVFHIEKIKIFSRKGEVLFSTDAQDLGIINDKDYFLNSVAKGNIYSKIVQKNTRSLEERLVERDVIEIYIPIVAENTFKGAFELYYDITPEKEALGSLFSQSNQVHLFVAVFLFMGFWIMVFRAGRSDLQRKQAENNLKKSHEHLENRVTQRTTALVQSNQALKKEISDRRAVQETLLESEERFRNICDSAQDAIIMMDHQGKISFWNKAAEQMFQQAAAEVLGKDLHEVVAPGQYHAASRTGTQTFIQNGEGFIIGKLLELSGKRKNGEEFPLELSVSRTNVQGHWHAIGIIRDISERKKSEQEKTRLEAQIVKSQKMESIGNLAGGIAHDFNNILSAIIGNIELSLYEVEPGTGLEESLQEVYTAGKRAKDLVRQILMFARQSDELIKPIQMDGIAKEVLKLLRSSIPASIEIKSNIHSDALIMGNPTQVHQIFMNLCTNAAHAMEEKGGILEFSLKEVTLTHSLEGKGIDLKPGNYMEIKVSDTGIGIPLDMIDKIFEPYFTTKGVGEGTGMGLALVHGIITSYGGKIKVDSVLGKGTQFTLYLPVIQEDQVQDTEETRELPQGTERILFVDDEVPIATISGRILEHLGYSVITQTNSLEALEVFRENLNKFDLVITDMNMPSMEGDKLAMELIKIRPDIPVILCTGYSKRISEETISEMGIKALALKPVVSADLAEMVRKVLDEAKDLSQGNASEEK